MVLHTLTLFVVYQNLISPFVTAMRPGGLHHSLLRHHFPLGFVGTDDLQGKSNPSLLAAITV